MRNQNEMQTWVLSVPLLEPKKSLLGRSKADRASTLLSLPVIRFIRENRGLTIAVSLGILVAVWLAANDRGRAHRR